jgi:hypothetical protein
MAAMVREVTLGFSAGTLSCEETVTIALLIPLDASVHSFVAKQK